MTALLAKALAIAVISYGPCPGVEEPVAGCTAYPNQVYLRTVDPASGPLSPVAIEESRNHELGHIIDYNLLTNADRGMFQALMHRRGPWRQPGPRSPHEQFAESVRHCARSTRWFTRYTINYDYEPTLYQHRKICRWLASIGARP